MTSTVYTTYFGGLSDLEADADVLAVVRHPRDFVWNVTERNVPALAPSENLLTAYKRVETAAENDDQPLPAEIAWNSVDFERRYRRRLRQHVGAQRAMSKLRERLRDGYDIALVCWEKNPQWCHRRILADVLVDPLDSVETVHRPDPVVPEHDAALTRFGGGRA
ncbi:DUF488 family protein [Halarchaeum salinum]|uniref:DUF488 domain-containing protein n=1 Tax=Halarchaeum salinum TaxID=489912 RepID=A0AAV3S4B1_9EURY